MTDSERSVSTTLAYVLMFAVATVLVGGLLIAGGNFVQDQRSQVIRTELGVVGQQIAADVASADRLVAASDGTPTVTVGRQRPTRVAGSGYRVQLVATSDPYLILTSTRPEVSITVSLSNRTALRNSTAWGGDIRVVYNQTADKLVISNAE